MVQRGVGRLKGSRRVPRKETLKVITSGAKAEGRELCPAKVWKRSGITLKDERIRFN